MLHTAVYMAYSITKDLFYIAVGLNGTNERVLAVVGGDIRLSSLGNLP